MFDALLALLAPNVEMPLGVDASNDFTSFNTAFAVEVPYGLREAAAGDEMDLSHALGLSVEDSDPAARLHAMMKGRLRFVPATGNEAPRLELQPLPIHLLLFRRNSHLSPLFKRVLYGNVEPSSVEAAMTTLLTDQGVDAEKIAERVGEFMAGSRGFTVAAGDFIGRPAQDSALGGRRRLDLMIKDRDGFYLNPGHFLFQWPAINLALENHPLLGVLEPVQHTMIFGTKSRPLYVRKNNSSPQSPYLTEATAAQTIGDALSVALLGDIVIVIDDETYSEKILMLNGVTVTSRSGSKVKGRVGLHANLPTIECPDDDPAVTFKLLLRPANISGFIIKHAANKTGSGILLDFCKSAEVAKNRIVANHAHQGGGISIVNNCASLSIKQNVIGENSADDGGSGVNKRGQGGGVYITKSRDITIEDNAFYGNTADNFGGGIAIVGASDTRVKKNDIGIGAPKYSVSIGNDVTKESPTDWSEYSTQRNPQGGGGGIGLTRGIKISIADNTIQNNTASRGGGIEVYSVTSGVLISGNTIKKNEARKPDADADLGGDGGGVAMNYVSVNLAEAKQHSAVTLQDNVIDDNRAADDGGGVYGTGKAIILITGNKHKITNNEAQLNGGGVRATFGSWLAIQGGEISSNKANQGTGTVATPGGGGGVSLSNSNLKIKDSTIKENQVQNFGGGGVYFATPRYETQFFLAMASLSFTIILKDAYQYTKGEISLENCIITGNEALQAKGAGGGLYVVYDDYPIHLKVLNTSFSGNLAQHTDFSKKLNVVIQSAPNKHTIVNDNNQEFSPLKYEHTFTNDD